MHLFRSFKRVMLFLFWVIVLGNLTGCMRDSASSTSPKASKNPQTPTAEIITEPVASTATPTIANTAIPSRFDVTLLRERQLGDGEKYIVIAFWSQDASTVYYALDTGETTMPRSPEWFAFNVQSRKDVSMSSPPPIIQPPGFLQPVYPQYDGFVSPSRRYRLDLDTNITDFYNRPKDSKSILWLIDTLGEQEPIKLIESKAQILRNIAYWLPGEHKVIFSVTLGESGNDMYLLDVDTRSITPLQELIKRDVTYLFDWSLSPDGQKIVVIDYEGLQILTLEGENLVRSPGYFYRIKWSPDSRLMYYFHGPEWYKNEEIGVYDLSSGKNLSLFSTAELEAKGVYGCFDFSPQGDQVIFWSENEIWLVTHFDVPFPLNSNP